MAFAGGGQMHLGFFAPFLILIFKRCFLSRSALAGAGKAGGGLGGQRDVPLPGPSPPRGQDGDKLLK